MKRQDTNLFGVSAKGVDVVLDPLQRHPLVQQTHVAGSLRGAVQSQEAEGTDPVVHGDHNDRLAVSEVAAIVHVQRRGATVEPWTCEESQHVNNLPQTDGNFNV